MSARLVVADIAACYVAVEELRSTIAWWQSCATAWRRPIQCKCQGRGPRRPATHQHCRSLPIWLVSGADDGPTSTTGPRFLAVTIVAVLNIYSLIVNIVLLPTVDSILTLVLVWRIRGKIIITALCCVVYDSNDTHTHVNSSYVFAC